MVISHPLQTTRGRGGSSAGAVKASGFTYFTVMMVVVIMGAGLAAIGTVWHQAARREKERELLFVGGEFRRAIGRYFEGSPGGPQFPKSLDDLLLDKRLPVVSRHLRKVYVDPMTGTRDWGLVKDPAGAIVGVYSKAVGKPLKSGKFNEEDKAFDAAVAYADWKFVYGSGSLAAASPGIQGPGLPSALEPATEAPAIPLVPPRTHFTARRSAREATETGVREAAGEGHGCLRRPRSTPHMQTPVQSAAPRVLRAFRRMFGGWVRLARPKAAPRERTGMSWRRRRKPGASRRPGFFFIEADARDQAAATSSRSTNGRMPPCSK